MDICIFSLFAGSGLGVMPTPEEVAGLQLPLAEVLTGMSEAGATGSVGNDGASAKPAGESSKGGVAALEDTLPFILSEGLPPIPAKLTAKIRRGEFVDMAELLRDNLEAHRRGSLQDVSSGESSKRSRREIPDVLSWVQCFGTYIVVVTSKHPEKLRQLLAYQTLIVRESRRCGGKGWLAYDAMFRQQVAGNDQADWSKLNSSLYAVSFLAQASGARSCTLCMEADHAEEECVLAPSKREPRPCFGQASQAQAPRGGSSSRPSKG